MERLQNESMNSAKPLNDANARLTAEIKQLSKKPSAIADVESGGGEGVINFSSEGDDNAAPKSVVQSLK